MRAVVSTIKTGYRFRLSFLALVLFASLLWRSTVLLGSDAGCGLLGPHEHAFVGEVSPQDFAAHLALESACAPDATENDRQPNTAGRSGWVLSKAFGEANLSALLALAMAALAPLVLQWFAPLTLDIPLAVAQWHGLSLALPPPTPPPKTRVCISY